jgi:DMSO reductase anchor subunit
MQMNQISWLYAEMQMIQISWLYVVPGFMLFLFFIGALLYVLLKQSDQSSAKLFAILGVIILCLVHASRFLVNLVLAQMNPPDFMLYQGLFMIVSTLFYVLALSLILFAVFVGRVPAMNRQESGGERMPVAGSNPYTPPAS